MLLRWLWNFGVNIFLILFIVLVLLFWWIRLIDLCLVFCMLVLVVIISIMLWKFVLWLLLLVSVLLFIICSSRLKIFGCVFLILFSNSIVWGCLIIVFVSSLFWLKLMYFGGVLIKWFIVWCFIYLDILKCNNLIFSVFESCIVILVFFMLVGLVNKNELIGLCLWFNFVWFILIVLVSVLIVLFWLKISIFRWLFRFFSVLWLFCEMFFLGICVICVIMDLIFVMLIVFLCLFIGIRCVWVFVLLIMLMVLFGRWWLLIYFIVNLIVVCIVFVV